MVRVVKDERANGKLKHRVLLSHDDTFAAGQVYYELGMKWIPLGRKSQYARACNPFQLVVMMKLYCYVYCT